VTAPIELRHVSHRYGSAVAVDDVSLDVAPGITGLLGPNGAGKTTLLRILATVQAPSSGSARLLGEDVSEDVARLEIRRRLGYLPQELGFPPGFTAFGFLEYMAVLKEWVDPAPRRAEVRRVLDLVGLSVESTKRIRRLSGGMRRRLGLAQALIGTPELVILDEPTTGLDPAQRSVFRRLVLGLGTRATVLISTHQTEDVAAVCDHVIVMDRGAVRFHGAVPDFVATARGRVWLADDVDDRALSHQRVASGRYRHVGVPPPDADPTDPQVDDAYLLLQAGNTSEGAHR
jgi:ABC-2 type transport system ATP-binding protein